MCIRVHACVSYFPRARVCAFMCVHALIITSKTTQTSFVTWDVFTKCAKGASGTRFSTSRVRRGAK